MKKHDENKELIKKIRTGIRLKTKAPKVEKTGKTYNRKGKHKNNLDETQINRN